MRRLTLAAFAALAWLGAAGAGERPVVDARAGTVAVPATVVKQGRYEVLKGAIEYLLVSEGGKAYEAVFTTPCTPAAIHSALGKIGLRGGEPAREGAPPRGPAVRIFAEYEADGRKVRRAADEFVAYMKGGKPLEPAPWVFTGSARIFDPAANKQVLQATVTRSIVGLHYTDPSPLFQNPRAEARKENLYKANVKALPKAGSRVVVVFERVVRKAAPGTRRVHAFISGRVQGVGFRAFTQREARRLKLTGWVRNLADGRVEPDIVGPAKLVDALLATLTRGPRAARVETLATKGEPPGGQFETFEIRY